MTRLLGLVLLAVALWMLLEIGWVRLRKAVGAGRPAPPLDRAPEVTETLVRCAGCGVHVPRARLVAEMEGGLLCERCRSGPHPHPLSRLPDPLSGRGAPPHSQKQVSPSPGEGMGRPKAGEGEGAGG
jgi:hypothetical protein